MTSIGRADQLGINTPLWFLTSIFIIDLLFQLLAKYNRVNIWNAGLMSLFGYIIFKYYGKPVYWNFDISLIMSLVFFLGYAIRKRFGELPQVLDISTLWLSIITLVAGALTFWFSTISGRIDLNGRYLGEFLLLVPLQILIGITFVVVLSFLFRENKILTFYGKNTLIILGTHILLLKTLKYLFINIMGLAYYADSAWRLFLLVFIVMILQLLVILFLKKTVPALVGDKKH